MAPGTLHNQGTFVTITLEQGVPQAVALCWEMGGAGCWGLLLLGQFLCCFLAPFMLSPGPTGELLSSQTSGVQEARQHRNQAVAPQPGHKWPVPLVMSPDDFGYSFASPGPCTASL